MIHFEAPPDLISSLERYLCLSEKIIKFIIIKVLDLKKKTESAALLAENDENAEMDIGDNECGSIKGKEKELKNSNELDEVK